MAAERGRAAEQKHFVLSGALLECRAALCHRQVSSWVACMESGLAFDSVPDLQALALSLQPALV